MLKKSLLLLTGFLGLFQIDVNAQAPCIGSQSMTANPVPAGNNTYVVGTTVTFCYTLTNYAQSGADWIAGFAITLGPGWDPTSLTPLTPPNSCDGQGTWDWYTSCTGTASGTTWGPGFYYDTPAGSPNFAADGIPGNNFGDNCQNSSWDFCFTVTVGPCASASNAPLNIGIQALSDYQAGSWGNNACFDPPFSTPAQWPSGTPTAQCNCVLIVPNISITNASCAGQNNGAVTVFPQGVSPYSYQWSNGATTQTISNLAPGIYTCTVTDSTQCTKTVTIPVSAPAPIVLNETISNIACSANGGSISLAPTGGGASYTYLWNNGATTSSINNLPNGTYTVTVTSNNGCTQSGTYTILIPAPLQALSGGDQTSCGGDPVNISVSETGGTGPYSYQWSNGSTSASQTVNPLSTSVYTATVTDLNGCSSQVAVTVNVSSYPVLVVDPDTSICFQGSIQLNASGANSYSWSPSSGLSNTNTSNPVASPTSTTTYIVTGTNAGCSVIDSVTVNVQTQIQLNETVVGNICDNSSGSISLAPTGGIGSGYTFLWSNGSTSSGISGLSGGSYTVSVTDALGCSQSGTFVINSVIPISAVSGGDQTSCSGTAVTISASATGGTAPYTYLWDNGSTSSSQSVNPTNTTVYSITITDSNGCTSVTSVTVNAINYPVLQVSPSVSICTAGFTQLSVSGATTYSWSPVTGLSDPNISNPIANPTATTTYVVTGTTSGCSVVDSVTVNVQPLVQLNESVILNVCDNSSGSISLSPSGGIGSGYSYVWSNGSTSQSINGLSGGSYSVTVTDALGCTQTGTFSINTITSLIALSGGNQTICVGNSATISVSANGGSSPYSYLWDNGVNTASQTVSPANTTVYSATVTDANGCTSATSVTVTAVPYPVLQLSPNTTICAAGTTQLSVSGGTTYNWSPATGLNSSNISNPVASPVSTTTYTVTSANGSCSSVDSVTITVLPEIVPFFVPDTVQGFMPLTVNFNNSTTGANSYSWSFGDGNISTDQNPTNIYQNGGQYTVVLTATNSLGCTDTLSYSYIIVDSFSSLFIPNIFTPNGDNLNDEFHFEEMAIIEISCSIFNRWGKEVYSWDGLGKGWDGKSKDGAELPEGSYIYVVKATGIEGKAYDLNGFFQLVRGK